MFQKIHSVTVFLVFSISILFPSTSSAIPVTFSFDSYSGPAMLESLFTVNTDQTRYTTDGFVNGVNIGVDSSIEHELQEYLTWDLSGNSYSIETNEYFGQTDIDSNANPLYFYHGSFNADTSNMFSFVPAENTEFEIGDPIYLGTFTFKNQTWFTAEDGSFFDFTITASSETALLYNQEFHGTINLITNPDNLDTREERADWFSIVGRDDLGSVRVYESDDGLNMGSVEFWGAFGSLDLIEFRNPTNGAFLSSSTSTSPAPVPEPATILIFGTGLVGLVGSRIRRKKK